MHAMHKILLYYENGVPDSKAEMTWDIDDAIGRYNPNVFDYFEMTQKVIRGDDIVDELLHIREYQQEEIKYFLNSIGTLNPRSDFRRSDSIEFVIEKIFQSTLFWEPDSYAVQQAVNLATGEYCIYSNFYDGYNGTAKVTDTVIESVKQCPDKWVLIYVDTHS